MEKAAKKEEKESKSGSRPEMASMMHICSGLVGPKSGNVEKPLVFKGFLRGAKRQEHSKNRKKVMRKWFLVEKATKKGAKYRTNEPLDMRWQV